jgi:murein DD-endopeptidase MepM/ murein hydrolase activator NlpD
MIEQRGTLLNICFAFAIILASLDLYAGKEQANLAKVRSGDTIYSLLRNHGFTDDHRRKSFSDNVLPSNFVLAPGDLFKVTKNSSRTELRFFDRNADIAFLFWRQGKESGAQRVRQKFNKKVAKAEGVINGSLVESINRKVNDELLAYRFMDAYVLDYKLTKELQRGAKFKITYEKVYDGSQFIRHGEVLATELELNGRLIKREFIELKNGGIFVDHNLSRENRPFYAPVDYVSISSLFQPRRYHPIRKMRRAHEGIDFEIAEGSNIYSVQSGTVIRLGRNRGAGKFVVIRHANGYESYYNHLSAHALNLSIGDYVKNGQLIGYIGCTGYCTKPHLHFAIRKGGRFIDPIFLIRGYAYNQRDQVSRLVANVSK